MIVVDASTVVDALVAVGERGRASRERLRAAEHLAAPQLLDVEVHAVLRRLVGRGALALGPAQRARAELAAMAVDRYPFAPVADRVWALRDRVSSYDAWYVALAELLDAPLVSGDERLRRVAGLRCDVVAP